MRRLPLPRAFRPALVVLSVAGAGLVHSAASSRSAGAGMIVFASDRLKSEPGEIYSLAPATAPRDVSRSLAPDHGLAVAPAGDLIAFWSGRTGNDQIYLARADGSHARRVRQAGGDIVAQNPSFSPDGKQIAFDAQPAHALGTQTAIMVANVDGSGLRPFTTVLFRQSVHPTWQPSP
jgi:hypothetical protein